MSIHRSVPVFFTLVLALAFLPACSGPHGHSTGSEDAAMDSLVTAEWLNDNLGSADLVVLDATVMVEPDDNGGFRIVNGRANFEAGHIPTAGFADLMGELSDSEQSIGFAVPAPEHFATAMQGLGVSDNSRVVIYDATNGAWAARVWWMLRWVGFDNAALLDGGQNGWTSAGYSLSTEAPARSAGSLTVNLRPELIADRDEVRAAIDDDSVNIIDALPEGQYRGDFTMYARPGHIPGATNVPSQSLLDDTGHFKSADELDGLFKEDRDTRTITYCGGGIAASADAFIMTRLGFKDVSVYTASLQEWSTDAENPMETGPAQE
ncbi:MAG: sulfurtransferase [Sulfitobacter sp.]|nr:sulfurtransferase [Sulfitobacter sp.]